MKLSSLLAVFFALLILDATLALGQAGQQQQQPQEQEPQQQGQNPFVFEQREFATRFQEKQGRIRSLSRFSQKSELLRGIDNFRLGFLEAEPNTFLVPHHLDAEIVAFVRKGNGVVTLLFENRRESFDIRRGDIFRVPAGIVRYIVNKDNNQKLQLVELFQPIANPGQYERFFGAGSDTPASSFYKAFSNDVLEAVLQAKESEISEVFGQKNRGIFVEGSQEQIRELSQHQGSGSGHGIWPFGRHGPQQPTFNLYEKRPSQANQFGQFREADNDDFQPLQELNLAVSFTNISRGGMSGPLFNSKAWKVAIILSKDNGYFELAQPQSQQKNRPDPEPVYQRVSGQLRQESVVIVPPGHPAVFVAPNNRNLKVLSFEINAFRNEKFALAGRGNVYNQLPNVAKSLSFGAPAREVEQLFNRNREQFFFKGPQQQQGGGGEGELKMVV